MLTADEIEARVNAWIGARLKAGWFHAARTSEGPVHRARWELLGQWRECARHVDGDSPASTGLIVALAREAFGEPTIHTCPMRWPDGIRWIVTWCGACGSISEAREEAEAALLALEGAPQ